jgi:putative hemolysin
MGGVTTELVVVLLLVLLNGVFSMSEMAVVSARKVRLEQLANTGDRNARAALDLANEPNRFLSTIQFGITLVGIFTGAFGGAALAARWPPTLRAVPALESYADGLALALVVIAITYLSLIFGELVPKRLALNSPERVARLVARPMGLVSKVRDAVRRPARALDRPGAAGVRGAAVRRRTVT